MKHEFIRTHLTAYPFDNPHVKRIIAEEIRHHASKEQRDLVCCDPFANESFTTNYNQGQTWITNDMNPNMPTMFHLEANDFSAKILELQAEQKLELFDLMLFDPPYNLSQLKIQYEGIGKNLKKWQTLRPFDKCKDELARAVKIGGTVISFGFGSRGFGKRRGFKRIALYNLEPSGTEYRYNVQVVVERKEYPTLDEFTSC